MLSRRTSSAAFRTMSSLLVVAMMVPITADALLLAPLLRGGARLTHSAFNHNEAPRDLTHRLDLLTRTATATSTATTTNKCPFACMFAGETSNEYPFLSTWREQQDGMTTAGPHEVSTALSKSKRRAAAHTGTKRAAIKIVNKSILGFVWLILQTRSRKPAKHVISPTSSNEGNSLSKRAFASYRCGTPRRSIFGVSNKKKLTEKEMRYTVARATAQSFMMDITTILVDGEDHPEFEIVKQVFSVFSAKTGVSMETALAARRTFDFQTVSRNIWALKHFTMAFERIAEGVLLNKFSDVKGQRRLAQMHANMDLSPEMYYRVITSISAAVNENVGLLPSSTSGAADDAPAHQQVRAVLDDLQANFDNEYTFRGVVEGSQSAL